VSENALAESDLATEAVLDRLRTQRLGRAYEFFSVCASTNDVVRSRAAARAAEGLLVVADSQSAGRGRLGRSWHSPPGQNLYLSLLLRPALPARHATPLTLLAGASLARALANAGAAPRLRWPNDLLLHAAGEFRKAAGILTEMATNGEAVRHVVLGVGLNVNGLEFPPDLAQLATSLRAVCGRAFDRAQLLVDFLAAFENVYDDFLARGPASGLVEWRRYADLGRVCRIDQNGARVEGVATDIDDSGALLVRDDAGRVHRMVSGEVSFSTTESTEATEIG
jgi:BirA family transcriptional regulator, biotin operon repressor / biotin---[acetyl-CoA-carboxylase] ligase